MVLFNCYYLSLPEHKPLKVNDHVNFSIPGIYMIVPGTK